MKLGFVSAILADLSFEEVIDFAAEQGFACVEIMCWPIGKAERRYAGVTHIDVNELDSGKVKYLLDYSRERNVEISGLGYYPNPLDPDPENRRVYAEHIKKVILAAKQLGIGVMNTFIGKDKSKTIEENFVMFREVWNPIIEFAAAQGIKIGIENCPMYFTQDEWPGGVNLASTPAIWERMFKEIPSDYFGLNYDPCHLLWQQIDYVKPLYSFRDKIFHAHIKDAKVYKDKLDQVGIMATPLEYHAPKLPGLGDINFGQYLSALMDIGYKGCVCIEVEDRAFEATLADRKNALILSKRYIDQFMI